ncbi:MAG: class I SAM-dependent methyltransferase [Planctomycetota bacterium]|nr:MAG: class I SAM-dependent methyltransferase [Planctomycetota bacterium]
MNPEFVEMYAEYEREHWWFRARRRILLDIAGRTVKKNAKDGAPRIADIGCGPGANMKAFAALGEVVGIDATPEMVAAARSNAGAPVSQATAEATGLPDGGFDLVLCLDVLEHLEDDSAAVAECYRITAPGGNAIITVPAVRSLWSNHDAATGHLRRYEKASLMRICRRAGFSVEFCSYFNTLLFLPALLVRLTASGRGAGGSDFILRPGITNRLLESIFAFEKRLLKYFSLPFGLSLAAVLHRPSRKM